MQAQEKGWRSYVYKVKNNSFVGESGQLRDTNKTKTKVDETREHNEKKKKRHRKKSKRTKTLLFSVYIVISVYKRYAVSKTRVVVVNMLLVGV